MPPFWFPFEPALHPAQDTWSEPALAWMRALGLHADQDHADLMGAYQIGLLIRYTAPRAQSALMSLAVRLNLLFHAFDDRFGDGHSAGSDVLELRDLVVGLHRVLDAPEAACDAVDPFVRGLGEVYLELARVATGEQLQLWCSGIKAFLWFEVSEALDRSTGQVPGLNRYLDHCILGRAAEPSLTILPILGGYSVPPAEMRSRAVRALIAMGSLIACLDNDRFSLAVERERPEHAYNIIKILTFAYGGDEERAIAEAVALRDQIMVRFLTLRDKVLASPLTSEPTRRFLADVMSWLIGQLMWGHLTPRFNSQDREGPTQPQWAPGPVAAAARSMPVAIAWLERVVAA
jgi:hypothetical protein